MAVLFLMELCIDIAYFVGNYYSPAIESVNPVLYLIVSVALAAFFLYTSVKILVALRKITSPASSEPTTASNHKGPNRRAQHALRNTAIKIAVTGGSLVILCVPSPIFAVRDLAQQMPVWVTLWSVIHFFFNIKALATILAFTPPRLNKLASSRGTGTGSGKPASGYVPTDSDSLKNDSPIPSGSASQAV